MFSHWRVLQIDLSSGDIHMSAIAEDTVMSFIGGRGIGAYLLRGSAVAGVDPLKDDVPLILAAGPLTGASIPSGDRFSLSTISPLTGTVMDANSGGRLGRSLRRGGSEILIITGKSDGPVTLVVNDGEVAIEPAGRLWGLTVTATMEILRDRWGKDTGLAVIGPAGENRVRYASIMAERMRAMGRGGAGAVMGGKGIKALVVKGTGKVPVHDGKRLKFVLEESNRWLRAHPVTAKALPSLGTHMLVRICTRAGIFPLKNFTHVAEGEDQAYTGEELARSFTVAKSGCTGCPIQ